MKFIALMTLLNAASTNNFMVVDDSSSFEQIDSTGYTIPYGEIPCKYINVKECTLYTNNVCTLGETPDQYGWKGFPSFKDYLNGLLQSAETKSTCIMDKTWLKSGDGMEVYCEADAFFTKLYYGYGGECKYNPKEVNRFTRGGCNRMTARSSYWVKCIW